MEESSNDNLDSKKNNSEKIRFTAYLTEEAEKAFTELYIHRLRRSRIDKKIDRSQIVCEALIELYKKECEEK